MKAGCQRVRRIHEDGTDVVVGTWDSGRIGVVRGLRRGERGYGGTAFGAKGIAQIGPYGGYRQLLKKIITFFRSGEVPAPPRETLEIYAFTAAADESKRRDGAPVCISEVLAEARSRQNERRDD